MSTRPLDAAAVVTAPRGWRRVVRGLRIHAPLWAVEVLVLNAAFVVAFIVRYGGRIPPAYSGELALVSCLLLTAAYSGASIAFRAYRSVWRYVTLHDMMTLAMTVATAAAFVGLVEVTLLRDNHPIPLSALVIGAALSYLTLTHLKLGWRLRYSQRRSEPGSPLIVIGAGSAGVALVRQLQGSPDGDLNPVAFIDDDQHKVGRSITGLPVVGGRGSLAAAVSRYGVTTVAIAIPSASPATIRELSTAATDLAVKVMVVPTFQEQMGGRRRISLRHVGLEDLFGRSEAGVDLEQIGALVKARRVLITGAAGSIGSELARQLSRLNPETLVLVDINETGLTDLRDELAPDAGCDIRVLSITHREAVRRLFEETRPQIVIHAAAMKHVDVVEEQPHEAARVNVLGTAICAEAAEDVEAELFLLVSTDKAVEPTNMLGATKRIGERLVTSRADGPTRMLAVRFGNVLGSRGSVVPRFERQIAAGGPITVTHPDVERYFMSIPEAVRLILQTATMGRSGRVYVLDMGEQVRIVDLATRLAGLRGLRVPDDIPIVFSGLRSGERLREQLVQNGERPEPTSHPMIRELTDHGAAEPRMWRAALGHLEVALEHADAPTLHADLLALAVQEPARQSFVAAEKRLPVLEPS